MLRTTHRQPVRKAKKSYTQDELAMIDRSVTAYYDSLSREEAEELSKWGEFGLCQLLNDDD